jgi:hypothetical protein
MVLTRHAFRRGSPMASRRIGGDWGVRVDTFVLIVAAVAAPVTKLPAATLDVITEEIDSFSPLLAIQFRRKVWARVDRRYRKKITNKPRIRRNRTKAKGSGSWLKFCRFGGLCRGSGRRSPRVSSGHRHCRKAPVLVQRPTSRVTHRRASPDSLRGRPP